MSRGDHRQEETPEQRESGLRSMVMDFEGRMVEGREFRESVLEEMQATLPGIPVELYAAELDAALARIVEAQVDVIVHREKRSAETRELDRPDAMFTLRYYNRRYSGRSTEYGLGPIDPVEALSDLYSHEQIAEAVVDADALIDEGIRMSYGSWDHEPNMAHLRRTPRLQRQVAGQGPGLGAPHRPLKDGLNSPYAVVGGRK